MREKQERKSLEQRENAKLGRRADGIFVRDVKETHMGDMRGTEKRSPRGASGEDRFLLCFGQIRCKCGRRDPLNPGARLPHTSLKNAPPIRSIGGAYPFMDTRTPIRKSIPVGVSLFVSGSCNRQSASLPERVQTGLRPGLLYPSGSFFMRFLGTTII